MTLDSDSSLFDAAISKVMGEAEEPRGQPDAATADKGKTQPHTEAHADDDDREDSDQEHTDEDDDEDDDRTEDADDESEDDDDQDDQDDEDDQAGDTERYDSEEFEIDGKTFTRKQLREMEAKEKNLQAGYTKKYQRVAETQKEVSANLDRSVQTLKLIQSQLATPLKQFDGIDWAALKVQDPAKYQQLQGQYQHAMTGYRQVEQALNGVQEQVQKQQKAELVRKAQEAREALQEQHADWSTELYRDVINFAVSKGVPKEEIANETRPWVISAMLEQMRTEKARDIKPKPQTNSVKRTIKEKAAPKPRTEKQKRADALKRDQAKAAKGDRQAQRRVEDFSVDSQIDRLLNR